MLTMPNIISKARKEGFGNVDFLYLDSQVQPYWLDQIAYRKAIYAIVDFNSGFGKSTTAQNKIEREVAKKVDAVLYTARNLKAYVDSLKAKDTLYLPNGVDFQH
ncbi:unnamed protein product, partial [marine sediment metagenome]